MTTNLHDKMLAAIDAYFSASDAVEEEAAENLLLDVRDELLKQPSQPTGACAMCGALQGDQIIKQPAQQEPVTFYRCNGCGHAYEQVHPTSCDCMEGSSFEQVNYYTSPQAPAQPQPLTDEQIDELYGSHCGDGGPTAICEHFARAIEAAHGITSDEATTKGNT